jgi:hypothetical protein
MVLFVSPTSFSQPTFLTFLTVTEKEQRKGKRKIQLIQVMTTTEKEDRRKKICFNCGKKCKLCCTKCRVIFFCDKRCARAAWKTSHKDFCSQVSSKFPGLNRTNVCLIVFSMNHGSVGQLGMLIRAMVADRAIPRTVLDARGPKVAEQVATLLDADAVQSVLMLGWGLSSMQSGPNETFKQSLVAWVKNGGRLMLHGKTRYWPEWFGKEWDDVDPRHCFGNPKCFAGSSHWCEWYPKASGAIVSTYESDGIALKNVDKEDILFGFDGSDEDDGLHSGLASIAWAKYEKGSISYFGDFMDPKSFEIIATIAAGDTTSESSLLKKNIEMANRIILIQNMVVSA